MPQCSVRDENEELFEWKNMMEWIEQSLVYGYFFDGALSRIEVFQKDFNGIELLPSILISELLILDRAF
jgi:hypothetical protein